MALTDGDEVNTHNSSPIDSDSDDDTILDGIEVRHATFGFDPAVDSSTTPGIRTSGDSVVTEGSGNWDTTTTNWTTDVGVTNELGGTAPAGAIYVEDLIFGGGTAGTAGTVTLTATGNDYGSIEFLATNAGTYTIDLNGQEVELRRSANTFLDWRGCHHHRHRGGRNIDAKW